MVHRGLLLSLELLYSRVVYITVVGIIAIFMDGIHYCCWYYYNLHEWCTLLLLDKLRALSILLLLVLMMHNVHHYV